MKYEKNVSSYEIYNMVSKQNTGRHRLVNRLPANPLRLREKEIEVEKFGK